MPRVKQRIKGAGTRCSSRGPFWSRAVNICRNAVDGTFDAIRRKTARGHDEAVNHHRFADLVISGGGHASHSGWTDLA